MKGPIIVFLENLGTFILIIIARLYDNQNSSIIIQGSVIFLQGILVKKTGAFVDYDVFHVFNVN